MNVDDIQSISSIAQSLTVTFVLLMWLFSEMRARNKLSEQILDDWNDLRRERKITKSEAE